LNQAVSGPNVLIKASLVVKSTPNLRKGEQLQKIKLLTLRHLD